MSTSEPGPDRLTVPRAVLDHADLIRRLVAGDPASTAQVIEASANCDDPALLLAAAVASGDRSQLERAATCARTARDRQLVVLADAHLRGRRELFSVLVREHLSEYPDHVLAAWIAAAHA